MNTLTGKKMTAAFLAGILMTAAGCTSAKENAAAADTEKTAEVTENGDTEQEDAPALVQDAVTSAAAVTSGGLFDASDFFTERDLKQTADLSEAQYITLSDGQDVNITQEGVYVLNGTANNVTVRIEADDSAKVQIVLNGVNVTNTDSPVIYVVSADKVFVTTTETENTMTVSGTFTADGETNTDAVIFAKDDIVFNGLGTLKISSTDNGISCKDDLKITGGTYVITASGDGIEANDSVRISGGTVSVDSGNDGIQVKNDDDNTTGYVYICGGDITVDAYDDAVHGNLGVQIDGGSLKINAAEGIEGTYVQINGGSISISASDDGINAAAKTDVYVPTLEITGGELTVNMAQGDTDALDSNGYIYIKGGTVDITAQFAFDFEYGAEMTGGTVTVNGTQVTTITESMMGGGMMGGPQGGFGGEQGGFGGGPQGGFGGGRP